MKKHRTRHHKQLLQTHRRHWECPRQPAVVVKFKRPDQGFDAVSMPGPPMPDTSTNHTERLNKQLTRAYY